MSVPPDERKTETAMQIDSISPGIISKGLPAGKTAVLVRTAGTELVCSVDGHAPRADQRGSSLDLNSVWNSIRNLRLRRVLISGEEPLLESESAGLANRLIQAGYETYIECCLTVELDPLDSGVKKLAEIKCPSQGTCSQVDWRNLAHVSAGDSVFFTIADANDYVWALAVLKREKRLSETAVYFSPGGSLAATDLSGWLIRDALDICVQLPLNVNFRQANIP